MAVATSFLPATVTIPDLPPASTLVGTELLEGVQTSGSVAGSVKLTVSQILSAVVLPGPFQTTSLTSFGVVYGNGTSALGATAAGTTGWLLTGGGTTAAPVYRPTNFSVEDYGAVGNGSTDDTAAFSAALAAAVANGGGAIYLNSPSYKITSVLATITTNNIYFVSERNSTILCSGAAVETSYFGWVGTDGGDLGLASNIAAGDVSVHLSAVTGLATGDVLFVYHEQPGGQAQVFISRINSVVGSVVSLDGSVPFAVNTGDAVVYMAKYLPVVGGGMRGITFDGTASTNEGTAAISTNYGMGQNFDNLSFKNWIGAGVLSAAEFAGSLFGFRNFECNFTNLIINNCGYGGSNSVQWYQCCNCYIDNIDATAGKDAPGGGTFGPGIYFSSDMRVGSIISRGRNARNIKISNTVRSQFAMLNASGADRINIEIAAIIVGNQFGMMISDGTQDPPTVGSNTCGVLFTPDPQGPISDNLIDLIYAKHTATTYLDVQLLQANGGTNNAVNAIVCGTTPTVQSGWMIQTLNGAPYTTISQTIDTGIGSAQGDILYRTATSWAVLTPGTNGQLLQTQGASANPRWIGGMALLNTLSPSAVASATDTTSLTATYRSYMVTFDNMVPATTATLQLSVATSGSTFLANSYCALATIAVGGTTIVDASATALLLSGIRATSQVQTSLLYGVNGFLRMFNPASTTARKNIVGEATYLTPGASGTSTMAVATLGGYYDGGSNAVTGLAVAFSSGLIATGTIKIYGIT